MDINEERDDLLRCPFRGLDMRPGPVHGLAYEPDQALIGAVLSNVDPVPSVSWPLIHPAKFQVV